MPHLARFCLALLVAPAFGTDARIVDTDICTLVAHPKDFNKKTVRVRARVESDGIEHTALFAVADSCKGKAVALWTRESVRDNPDQKALDDAIFGPPTMGTVAKRITATFTGQFLWHPRKHPRRVLMAEKVEDLNVEITRPDFPK